MNEKITYLFGAGASANALPVVKDIPNKLKDLLIEIKKPEHELDKNNGFSFPVDDRHQSKYVYQQEFIKHLEWIINNVENHSSIDTFAKKTYLTKGNNRDYRKIKTILTLFFQYEQLKNRTDQRYDSFFASLVDLNHQLPTNLRILSWNYDCQFERAFSLYMENEGDLDNIQNGLRVYPSNYSIERADEIPDLIKLTESEEDLSNAFSIFKINGTTAYIDRNNQVFTLFQKQIFSNIKFGPDEYEDFIRSYFDLLYSFRDRTLLLNYAWEKTLISRDVIAKAIKATNETTILVVVGYSFPFFNREIDRELIRSMGNLKKVYFQGPKEDIKNYPLRFRSITTAIVKDQIEEIPDVDQFFLPPEL